MIQEAMERIEALRAAEKVARASGNERELELIRDELHALERQLDWD